VDRIGIIGIGAIGKTALVASAFVVSAQVAASSIGSSATIPLKPPAMIEDNRITLSGKALRRYKRSLKKK
jgi:hypothetical protein